MDTFVVPVGAVMIWQIFRLQAKILSLDRTDAENRVHLENLIQKVESESVHRHEAILQHLAYIKASIDILSSKVK